MSMEEWIEVELKLRSSFDYKCYERLLLDFIGPIIEELEENNELESFHFFFEPEMRLLLRIQLKESNLRDKVKDIVKKHLPTIGDFTYQKTDEELFRDYEGESKDFGEDGWKIAKKVFECGSRMAIAKFNSKFRKGKKFQEGKLLHCFLNSLGYSTFGPEKGITLEALFHLGQFIGRMLILSNKQMLDQEAEEKIRDIFERTLNNWKGKNLNTSRDYTTFTEFI